MIPFKMLTSHDPERGEYGDCVRTCIASLLDTQPANVPHFFRRGPGSADEAWPEIETYLNSRGYTIVSVPVAGELSLEQLLTHMSASNPDIYYMVSGRSIRADHFVIALNGEIVMDPSYSNTGLAGPGSTGLWYVMFLSPLNQKYKK